MTDMLAVIIVAACVGVFLVGLFWYGLRGEQNSTRHSGATCHTRRDSDRREQASPSWRPSLSVMPNSSGATLIAS